MAVTTAPPRDERMAATPLLRRLMARPELGAVAGTILVFLFFAVAARGTGMFSRPWASSPSSRCRPSWASSRWRRRC